MSHPVPVSKTILRAAEILRAGGLVILPTETVYGLGADATNDRAVAEIFRAKGRPRFNPLIVHVSDVSAARELVEWNRAAELLAERFWPGPLTLVLRRREPCPVSLLVSAGLDTIAIRVPDHPVASALLRELGRPIAAPSANRSGEMSPTTAEHAAQSMGAAAAMVLDGGRCKVGLESTIVDISGTKAQMLRPAGVTHEAIAGVIGDLETTPQTLSDRPRAPGMLTRHYAPGLPLRLNATRVDADEALLAFGREPPQGAAVTLNLSAGGDLTEAAANFFAMLHALDRSGCRAIAVMPVPETGLGCAIHDRLRRAATPANDTRALSSGR